MEVSWERNETMWNISTYSKCSLKSGCYFYFHSMKKRLINSKLLSEPHRAFQKASVARFSTLAADYGQAALQHTSSLEVIPR